jgi:hypothetical protein
MEKKRVIVDYSTLPDDVLHIMSNRYPDGYEHDIIKFPNAKGELISAVRVETDDIIYLVKVSKQLEQMVEDFEDEDGDEDEVIDHEIVPKEIKEELESEADDDDPDSYRDDDELDVDDEDDDEDLN